MRLLLAALALLACVVLALSLALRAGAPAPGLAACVRARLGGAARRFASAPARRGAPVAVSRRPHRLGRELFRYARGLDASGGDASGGGEAAEQAAEQAAKQAAEQAAEQAASPARHWTEFGSWEALRADPEAQAAYLAARAAAVNSPAFDWSRVLAELAPRLLESREYIGIANAGPDGRTLEIAALEAGPDEAGGRGRLPEIPAELVAKVGRRPGLFIFHTHPADPRGSPLPSSHDLSLAVHFGALDRFAASVVVSRYGALLCGLDWEGYRAIKKARDPRYARLNLSHDVVAAHEAMRSWASWTLNDYFDFYPRHRLFFAYAPSPEMVGDIRRKRFCWDLETPIDHALIEEHSADIDEHLSRVGAPRPALA